MTKKRCAPTWIVVAGLAAAGCGSGGSPLMTGTGGGGAAGRAEGSGGLPATGAGGGAGAGAGGHATGGAAGSTTTGTGGGAGDAGRGTGGVGGAAGAAGPGAGGAAGQGMAGSTGAAGQGMAGATGAAGDAIAVNGGRLLEMFGSASGITVAVDASSRIHVAALAKVQDTDNTVVYAMCATGCESLANWSAIALGPGDYSMPPTIALTADGRPRLVFLTLTSSTVPAGNYYAECDSNCFADGSWKFVRLTDGNQLPSLSPPARGPFAVSAQGAALFGYAAGNSTTAYSCRSNCGDVSSWTATALGDYVSARMVAFGPNDSPEVVEQQVTNTANTFSWYACSAGDCSSTQNWLGVTGLWSGGPAAYIQGSLAVTAGGAPRVEIYGQASSALDAPDELAFAACDSQCQMGTGWSTTVVPTVATDSAGIGFDLAADGASGAIVSYASDTRAGTSRCAGSCTTAQSWQETLTLSADTLTANIPFVIPANCTTGFWTFFTGPAVALFPDDRPVLAFTGQMTAGGGSTCGYTVNGAFSPTQRIGEAGFILLPK